MLKHFLKPLFVVLGLAVAAVVLAVSFEIAPYPEPTLTNIEVSLIDDRVKISAWAYDVSGVYGVTAIIKDSAAQEIRRISLFDDGGHSDGAANDNTFANFIYWAGLAEGRYYVDVFALDTIGYRADITNAGWFDVVLPGACEPGDEQSQSCGNCGTQTQICLADGYWSAPGECTGQEGKCSPGATQSQDCGNCGTQTRICTDTCQWPSTWDPCAEPPDACAPGKVDNQTCGTNGSQSRTCTDLCAWDDWTTCQEQGTQPGECIPGDEQSQSCGNCGTQTQICLADGYWSAPGECTGQEGKCSPGATQSQDCGNCGTQTRICTDTCQWPSTWDPCAEPPDACTPGQVDNQTCGINGSQTRTCQTNCTWGSWGTCVEIVKGVCTPGEQQEQSCGYCGTQTRTCQEDGTWPLEWGACTGQGDCPVGKAEFRTCGNCGYELRTCTDTCQWTVWSGCLSEGDCAADVLNSPDCPCPVDGCYGSPAVDYYDYPDYGNCTNYCTCATSTESGQPCEPVISPYSQTCDSTAPVTTFSAPDGYGWANTDLAFELSCSDNLSGCQTTEYKVINDIETCDGSGLTFGTSGTVACAAGSVCQQKVCYRSQDNAGNQEPMQTSNIFYIDKTAPTYGGYSNISGYSYQESPTVYWVKGGDSLQIDIAHSDIGSGVMRQYFGFNKDDCAPNACGGAPNELKSYSDYGSGLTDVMADNTYIDISAVSCVDPDLVCSDDDMSLRWTADIKASSADWDWKLHTFQYDKTWNGLGYTDLGVWVKVDNSAPSVPIFSPVSSTWAAAASVTVSYDDGAGSGIEYTRHCWTEAASCDPGTDSASTFDNGIPIVWATPGQWNLCTRASDNVGNWTSVQCSGLYQVGQCSPGTPTTCTSPQGCSHTITCQADYTWPSCPTDECGTNSECPCAGTDGCVGTDYYDYPPNGLCLSDCACDISETAPTDPCYPTITVNSPTCDTTPPTSGWTSSGFSTYDTDGTASAVTQCSDAGSGVKDVYVAWRENDAWVGYVYQPYPYTCVSIGSTGQYIRCAARCRDNAGNLDPTWDYTTNSLVDTALPTVDITSHTENGTYYSNTGSFTMSGTAADVGSGLQKVVWNSDGAYETGTIDLASPGATWSKTWTSVPEGQSWMYIASYDIAANFSGWNWRVIWIVDTTAPSTTISPNGSGWTNSNVAFTLTCSDNLSGCQTTQYKIVSSGTTCDNSGLTFGTSGTVACAAGSVCQDKVCYRSQDNAGNWEAIKTSNIFYIDKQVPTQDSLTISNSFWETDGATSQTITLKSTELGSGIGGSYGMMALIFQDTHWTNARGYFGWSPTKYIHGADQMTCTGGGYASKSTSYGAGYITLTGCSTSVSGSQRTVVFTVVPASNFGNLSNMDISFHTTDMAGNSGGWQDFNNLFSSGECAVDSDCARCYNCNASGVCQQNPLLSCAVTSDSCSGQAVLKMSGLSNGHAELPTQANYNYYVCCSGGQGLSDSCSNGDTVLKLSKETNAHVEKKDQTNYAYPACLSTLNPAQNGTVSCLYGVTACPSGYTCLASIDKDTNSHIGDCSAYETKVCCTISCE